MAKREIVEVEEFARTIFGILKSDRDVNVGIGGFTGEGKSTFATQLQKAYATISGTYWGFDRMTWSRKELMEWIDGKKDSKVNPKTGLKENQLPEYSAVLPDELFGMFYRRKWFEDEQIDSITTLNMCRDRHLLLVGNVPNFFELDTGFTSRIRFYIYIPKRGIAWVFEQENNPFCTDNWNLSENRKTFRKKRNPNKIPNFVCEIHFPDWSPDEKQEYYRIRNVKRVKSISENKTEKLERYGTVKNQRDTAFRFLFNYNNDVVKNSKRLCKDCEKMLSECGVTKPFTNKSIGNVTGLNTETIRLVRLGAR